MICAKCCIAADLMEAATDLFTIDAPDGRGGMRSDAITSGEALAAMATAAAIVRLHTECDGSEQGCGCQHRDTAAERLPAGSSDRPAALITSPAVAA